MKQLIILSFFIFFAVTAQAMHPVVQESVSEAQSFKVEGASPEKEAIRDVAGESFSRRRRPHQSAPKKMIVPETSEKSDSEVQYWQYSE